jgi:glycosyltransferase involved in cell wall biosynthesis
VVQDFKMTKKKILLLSDDMRMTSGVATMSRELVVGTVHKYDWVQLGAAINHPEYGKIIDLNNDVREKTGVKDANVKIYPHNGYGDIFKLRQLIESEKPDAILHFTDPHYWQWLYDNEHEIRQQVPILYYHIWDDVPDPYYNRDYYESCDWLGCISKQTYGIVNRVGKSKRETTHKPLEDWQISYVPHGINEKSFFPIGEDQEMKSFIHGTKEYNFILFYNNRNIKRKQPSDVIYTYKMFCDTLPKEESSKCLLLMHTASIDNNGTDLVAVVNELCPDYDVKFTNDKFDQPKLNRIYNQVDCTINIANNEGFGLTTAESLMSGTPVIVNVTGGLQDQCGFKVKGSLLTEKDYIKIKTLNDKRTLPKNLEWGEWVVPVWPASITLNGSPSTPYIFDDRINHYDVVDAIKEIYVMGREERKRRGLSGREFMVNNFSSKVMCDSLITGVEKVFKTYKPKKSFELYKIS